MEDAIALSLVALLLKNELVWESNPHVTTACLDGHWHHKLEFNGRSLLHRDDRSRRNGRGSPVVEVNRYFGVQQLLRGHATRGVESGRHVPKYQSFVYLAIVNGNRERFRLLGENWVAEVLTGDLSGRTRTSVLAERDGQVPFFDSG